MSSDQQRFLEEYAPNLTLREMDAVADKILTAPAYVKALKAQPLEGTAGRGGAAVVLRLRDARSLTPMRTRPPIGRRDGQAAMAESSMRTPKKRGPGRPFQPGQSGNLGGRPKGIAERVQNVVGEDWAKLIQALRLIAQRDR